jgi:protein TonB
MYPPEAAADGLYGDLVLKFTIKKNGRLGAVELVRTSGHKNLDDAAIRALKDGAPFWPLPEEWGMEAYTIVGHFVYTLYGYYLR